MKALALAIVLVGLFYVDVESVKMFGRQYNASTMVAVLVFLSGFAFVFALILEK